MTTSVSFFGQILAQSCDHYFFLFGAIVAPEFQMTVICNKNSERSEKDGFAVRKLSKLYGAFHLPFQTMPGIGWWVIQRQANVSFSTAINRYRWCVSNGFDARGLVR